MIKDWVKGPGDNSLSIEYFRKDYRTNKASRYSFVRVWKIGLPAYERNRRGIGAYGVSARIGRNGFETKKTFKTKTEAMRFAKSYMRKN